MRHHARQDLYGVRLLALGGEARLSRTAAIQIVLDVLIGQRDQRRTAVDHAADRDPVAFAEGRDPEHVAEGVVRHLELEIAGLARVVTRGEHWVKWAPAWCLR